MAVSWKYRIPPHEIAEWPWKSVALCLGYGEQVAEYMEQAAET